MGANTLRTNGTVQLKDGTFLELSSGRRWTANGHDLPAWSRTGDVDEKALTDYAASVYYGEIGRKLGRPIDSVTMTDRKTGHLVTMDLAPTDVHIDRGLPTYAAGYTLDDGVADLAYPVVLTPHQSDKYFTWSQDAAFKRVIPNASSGGAAVSEINPTLSNSPFTTVEYALAAFVTMQVQANADAPLQPLRKATRRVLDALKLEREIRVATSARNSANYDASLVLSLGSTTKWNGGSSSDPIGNIRTIQEASRMRITRMIWSESVDHAFANNASVQSRIAYKAGITPQPINGEAGPILKLPPITVAPMKYSVPSAANPFPYVWGGDVILLRDPPEMPPTSGDDIATGLTFRWNGANSEVRDGEMTAGLLVRTFWDPKRGGRGGMQVVVVHNDAETPTSSLVGGLIVGAVQ